MAAPSDVRDAGTEQVPVLRVEGLTKYFPARTGFLNRTAPPVQAVDGVTLEVKRGMTLGLVGESGCGKSTLGRTIVRLLRPDSGQIILDGVDISTLNERELRPFRKSIQFVFQDSFGSLNPRMTAREIIGEPLAIHEIGTDTERRERVVQTLEHVGLRPEHLSRFPHEFSGGQRQRLGIARALVLNPKVLILDEPSSALDVSVQAQIANLLKSLQKELGIAYLLIAHDLAVIRHLCDDVAVMYLGRIVEQGARRDVFDNASHPYTKALLSAVPRPDPARRGNQIVLEGEVPSPSNPPSGCRFRTRCWKAQQRCVDEDPTLLPYAGADHAVACFFPEGRSG